MTGKQSALYVPQSRPIVAGNRTKPTCVCGNESDRLLPEVLFQSESECGWQGFASISQQAASRKRAEGELRRD